MLTDAGPSTHRSGASAVVAQTRTVGGMSARVPASREEAAQRVVAALTAACPDGTVEVIGSLATPARSDRFSDIDLRWTIGPDRVASLLATLRSNLAAAGVVESLRVDPDVRPDRLLVFVRYDGWPLWWRVDLELDAPGIGGTGPVGDADAWSPYESACMGVLVTVKALARGHPEVAEELQLRCCSRIGASDVSGGWPTRLAAVLDLVERGDPTTRPLVARVRELARDVLG